MHRNQLSFSDLARVGGFLIRGAGSILVRHYSTLPLPCSDRPVARCRRRRHFGGAAGVEASPTTNQQW